MPYWSLYSKPRMLLYSVTVSKYFDLAIAGVIGLNVITMALEFYLMPKVCPHFVFVMSRHRPVLSSPAIKGKGLDTCYSATYMSKTRDQQRFTISEVASANGAAAHYVAIHCPR